ncbi:hypothetical protein EDB85DRAFT_2137839 [Lactarius pseudohatsudake]|nr:hypothetical protein EDB85DRAFT_2137839 [Lactarius pseudohatsudake]
MLGKHLQRNPGDADFIKKFFLATWTVDAEAAINVILMVPKLEWLSLCIGINFEPEQLEHLFHEPIPNLRYLSLRFRPYNSRYSALSRAPAISVVQDPLDVPTSSSAQPLVFFHFNHLSVLASSPLLARTQALRLRIPGRGLVSIVHAGRRPPALPHITFLDLSTSRASVLPTRATSFAASRTSATSSSTGAACSTPALATLAVFACHCLLAGDALSIEYDVNPHLAAAS